VPRDDLTQMRVELGLGLLGSQLVHGRKGGGWCVIVILILNRNSSRHRVRRCDYDDE
jgi:hypothetical protein